MRKILLGASAAFLIAESALAADLPPVQQPQETFVAAPTMNWTGFWVGGALGGLWGDAESDTPGDPTVDISGFYAGVNGGFDWHMQNNLVLGAFLEVPVFMPDTSYTPAPGLSISTDLNWAVVGALRIGYAWDRLLPYGFFGGVVGEGETSSAVFPAVNQSQTHIGITAGAGLDFAVTDRIIVGGRYAYVNMGEETYTGYVPARSIDFDGHNLAVTARFKF